MAFLLLFPLQILLPQIGRAQGAAQDAADAAPIIPNPLQPDMSVKVPRPGAPPVGEWNVKSVTQTVEGSRYLLRGSVEIEYPE
ncbi:MAG: hypothetical protein M3Z36_09595, partial [Acidobacteriota bacterium]|nr:hypothetical protein [Acidobacteriota bacterium]